MINSVVFQNALNRVPEDVKIQVDLSMGIADRIVAILKAKISAVLATPLIGVSKDYIIQEETPVFVAEEESEKENDNDNYNPSDSSWDSDSSDEKD